MFQAAISNCVVKNLVVSLLVFASASPGQTQRTENPNVECIDRLLLPGFGAMARAAQRAGTVEAKIRVGKAGTVDRGAIELASPDPRLADEVRIMLELSKFSPRCGGKTVRLFFTFVRDGTPVENPVPLFIFIPPNRFEVVSRPTLPSVDYAPDGPKEVQ